MQFHPILNELVGHEISAKIKGANKIIVGELIETHPAYIIIRPWTESPFYNTGIEQTIRLGSIEGMSHRIFCVNCFDNNPEHDMEYIPDMENDIVFITNSNSDEQMQFWRGIKDDPGNTWDADESRWDGP